MGLEIYDGRGKWLDRFSSAIGVWELDKSIARLKKRWPLYHQFLQTAEQVVTQAFLN